MWRRYVVLCVSPPELGDRDKDDVLLLSEDEALPDLASPGPVPEPVNEDRGAAPRYKKPRDHRQLFFDNPVGWPGILCSFA